MATGMHLGVTLPQAVHHPPSYLCVPKSFLSMQLESEIPCQLIASFSCPFLVLPPLFVCSPPISAQITLFLSKAIVFFAFPNLAVIIKHHSTGIIYVPCILFVLFIYCIQKNAVLHLFLKR